MLQLPQLRPATLDLVLRTDDAARLYPLRGGLVPADVMLELKRAGATDWTTRELDAISWQSAGNGAYVLSLGAGDLDTAGTLLVFVSGRPGLAPPVVPSMSIVEVIPTRAFRAAQPQLDRTLLVGQLTGLDGQPVANATLTATLLQAPLLLEGVAVAGDAVIGSSNGDGTFELPLITGATVDLQIPAVRYRRTLVIPPPPAPGAPVRLFAIP